MGTIVAAWNLSAYNPAIPNTPFSRSCSPLIYLHSSALMVAFCQMIVFCQMTTDTMAILTITMAVPVEAFSPSSKAHHFPSQMSCLALISTGNRIRSSGKSFCILSLNDREHSGHNGSLANHLLIFTNHLPLINFVNRINNFDLHPPPHCQGRIHARCRGGPGCPCLLVSGPFEDFVRFCQQTNAVAFYSPARLAAIT